MKFLVQAHGAYIHFDHELKTWPDVFDDILSGHKTHEFRRNDRAFESGDVLLLREFVPAGERYTGREVAVQIKAISYGPEWGIPEGYAAFSIKKLDGTIYNPEET